MSDVCGKGTYNGAAAEASPYLFAKCTKERDHVGACDSGDELEKIARDLRDAQPGFRVEPYNP